MLERFVRQWLRKIGRNSYLEAHGFYDSFDRRRLNQSYGAHPFLPYSLADLLEQKSLWGRTVFVRSHGSTARWFARSRHRVTLGRKCRGNYQAASIDYLEDLENYSGQPIDIMVWDHPRAAANWRGILPFLAADGVVIIVYPDLRSTVEGTLCEMCGELSRRGMRMLRFQNPGPRSDVIFAELWYASDNVLGV